ncbi:hypothetical protein ACIPW5_38585 [Streptomyces sp. NPDC090077]|uniref:hypothetical protein n=1 Tax=Streptomyces sp. NPDC090077 TaxID=3365938 RepID=UPI0038230AF2
MSAPVKRDRARAFVPELIPEPADIERTGPLDAKEQQQLERIHAARDNHQAAKWMRGKALEAAFRRRLFRGEDGQRTRQQYLDDEWDGISESAAYREIGEWPLARAISDMCERPAPDSHVRALVDVAEQQGHEAVAHWYAELRRHGQQAGHRVTAEVVANLADYLHKGTAPERLEPFFTPRQLPPSRPARPARRTAGEPVEGTVVTQARNEHEPSFPNLGMNGTDPAGSFPNLGMSEPGTVPAAQAPGRWAMSAEHVGRLSAWLEAEAAKDSISPEDAADHLVQALTGGGLPLRYWTAARAQA